jgi:eukaryotic-like serine/threonine-protein kinase
VSVHEAGRWPSGNPFDAMKYVAGKPLSEVIAKTVTLTDRLALLPSFITVADAIAYAMPK